MATATWNGTVIASSEHTVVIEGNHYFPPESVNRDLLVATDHSTHCPWKGDASYYSLQHDGETETNAAWTYREPFEKAAAIRDHIAFYPVVEVTE